MPISYLCDRYTVNTAKSQIGFIDAIVFPTYQLLKQVAPKVDLSNFEINKNNWKDMIDHYEIELSKITFLLKSYILYR